MISFVRGRVAHVDLGSAVVDVGGVGLSLQCTPSTLAGLRVGDTATIATSLVVREDSMTLYGFADDDERGLFELLQTASGVGPKLAQAMLAVLPPDELRRAVASEDVDALTRVPGVGRKGAQRVVLELKDRVGPVPPAAPAATDAGASAAAPSADAWQEQVRTALVGLGWSAREADQAVEVVAARLRDGELAVDGAEPDVPALLRAALRSLARS